MTVSVADDRFLQALLDSFYQRLGRQLIDRSGSLAEQRERLMQLPAVVVAHNTATDPFFVFGNLAALKLWEMSSEQLIGMPSRLTAEPMHRDERAQLLARTLRDGYVDDYRGVRISSTGQRFMIEQAILWNIEVSGKRIGQAATFDHWTRLPS